MWWIRGRRGGVCGRGGYEGVAIVVADWVMNILASSHSFLSLPFFCHFPSLPTPSALSLSLHDLFIEELMRAFNSVITKSFFCGEKEKKRVESAIIYTRREWHDSYSFPLLRSFLSHITPPFPRRTSRLVSILPVMHNTSQTFALTDFYPARSRAGRE